MKFISTVFGIALLACLAGCGAAANQAKLRNDLKGLGLAYHSYHDEHQKGPANWDELIAFAGKANLFPDGIKRVRDAGYVVTWDAKFTEVTQGLSNTVLAKPAGEGPTLMMDGSVQ
ncbi:MAG TPA: hypothetical protein VFB80_14245 [Pirellulaceae bacterium]|nr:hypothetical protein [Pirellulaceae bacterium]